MPSRPERAQTIAGLPVFVAQAQRHIDIVDETPCAFTEHRGLACFATVALGEGA
jgi:hypothetical protein